MTRTSDTINMRTANTSMLQRLSLKKSTPDNNYVRFGIFRALTGSLPCMQKRSLSSLHSVQTLTILIYLNMIFILFADQ